MPGRMTSSFLLPVFDGGAAVAAQTNPADAGAGPTEQKSARTVPGGGMAGDQASPELRAQAHLHRGDELPAGAHGAGENVCRACGGSGRLESRTCETCGGTGKVIESVAGGP